MASKKNSQGFEHAVSLGAEGLSINRLLLPLSKSELENIQGFPRTLLLSAHLFIKRNSLAVLGSNLMNKKDIHKCCDRCLKAFLIEKVNDHGLIKQYGKILDKILHCEIGHNGYYLDSNVLKKITS